MKYMLLIHQGTTPLPGSEEWDALSEDAKGAVGGQAKSECTVHRESGCARSLLADLA